MILVSGEALVDLIPDAQVEGRYDAKLGGSPYNVAIGLARLGAPAAFISNLSADANGEALAAALAADGVDLSLAVRDPRPTPLAFVMRGTAATGSRYSFYLDATAFDGAWPFPAAWPPGARHLHVGSIAALDPRHGARAAEALARARSAGLSTSYDPNVRPMVTPDRDAVRPLVEKQAALASVVKASEEDLEWLYPGRPVEETLRDWASKGPLFAIVTRGGEGAVAWLGGERLVVPPRKVDVVDTVGAGDSFMSALLFAMNRDGALGAAARPTLERLQAWTDFAARASAITCTRRGSNPPTLADLEAATQ